jgi:BirA family biotin operon repressor/biotin-[acetyl-CoA-carboxylase] ligase
VLALQSVGPETQVLGVPLCTVRGRGYRLEEPLDLIDRGSLDALIASLGTPFQVDVLDECASTSTLLLERALNGAAHASVIVCEHQTAGRGRRGAEWISALGGSLAFSMLWRFQRPAGELSGLSLALAVGAAGLSNAGAACQVKWPNDLLVADASWAAS